MAGKDNFFKARMTDEQVRTLEDIVKEIQADTPEANVTASSVARYALEKYIDDYQAEKSGKKITITIDISNQNPDDLLRLYEISSKFRDKVHTEESENVAYLADVIMRGIVKIMPKVLEKKYGKKEG